MKGEARLVHPPQLTKALPVEHSFISQMGICVMFLFRFISPSLSGRVLFDRTLMAYIIHSFFFPKKNTENKEKCSLCVCV